MLLSDPPLYIGYHKHDPNDYSETSIMIISIYNSGSLSCFTGHPPPVLQVPPPAPPPLAPSWT
jgi:hypothetical protein